MKERITIVLDYEIEYDSPGALMKGVDAALECGIDVSGAGPEGHFRTRRVKTRVSAPEGQAPKQESLL